MDEIARVAPIYGGISHRRLESEGSLVLRTHLESPQPTQVLYASKQHKGLQWPCLDPGHSGTAVLYGNGFPDRKAVLLTPSLFTSVPELPEDYSLWFAPGRVLLQQNREIEIVKGEAQPYQARGVGRHKP